MDKDFEFYVKMKLEKLEELINFIIKYKLENTYEIESILLSKVTPRMKDFLIHKYGLLGKKILTNNEISKLFDIEEFHVTNHINLGLCRLNINQYKILVDELKNTEFKNAIISSEY